MALGARGALGAVKDEIVLGNEKGPRAIQSEIALESEKQHEEWGGHELSFMWNSTEERGDPGTMPGEVVLGLRGGPGAALGDVVLEGEMQRDYP